MASEVIFEDKDIQTFLRQLSKKKDDAVKGVNAYAEILSPIVFKDVIKHFEQERGPQGPWPEWSTSYRSFMQKVGKGSNKKLQDSGRMRNAFLPSNHRQASNGILWFNPAKTKDGFPYAYAHDTGGTRLPQREFMWLSDQAAELAAKATLDFMLEEK